MVPSTAVYPKAASKSSTVAELVATKDVNLDIGLIEPEAAEAKSLTELTLALSADLRGALLELEHLAADLDVELPPLIREQQ